MLVVIPYGQKDQHLARALLSWIAELGNVSAHKLLLVADEGMDINAEIAIGASCFLAVDSTLISPCSTGWPWAQNWAFFNACIYIEHKGLGPFLFLETDAIPLRPDWLNSIEAEYKTCGKQFMGYLEYKGTPASHMNGVGVWGDVRNFAPSALSAPTPQDPAEARGLQAGSFDTAGGAEVVANLHVSRQFQFQYKKEQELLRDETLSWLNPEAAIFHTCKDLRLISLLRKKLFGTGAAESPREKSLGGGLLVSPPSLPRPRHTGLSCDIFIKTYDKVADWHTYAMRSIDKYCSGFRRTVVIGQQPVESYQAMQVHKLNADLYTDSDYILTTDSDTIFVLPVTPQTYIRDGKTLWLYRTWGDAVSQEGDAVLRWRRGMSKFFGVEPPFEFMCRHPELIPRWLYAAFRIFCYERHGKTMAEWVETDKDFADWNMLGMYAWLHHREAFAWHNQSEAAPPPITVKQYWGGHTPIAPHIPEMEAILAGGVSVDHAPPGPIQRTNSFKTSVKRINPKKKAKAHKDTRTPERIAADKARMAKARSARKTTA